MIELSTPLAPVARPQTRPVVQPIPVPMTLNDDERQRCEVWTRVMGYHRPVTSFNIGKQGEFRERVWFVAPPPASGR